MTVFRNRTRGVSDGYQRTMDLINNPIIYDISEMFSTFKNVPVIGFSIQNYFDGIYNTYKIQKIMYVILRFNLKITLKTVLKRIYEYRISILIL